MRRENAADPDNADAGREPSEGAVHRALGWLDTGLTRLGLHGPFSRDLLLGVFVSLVSVVLLSWLVSLAAAEGTPFTPAAVVVLGALACAQSLVLCVRRRAPLVCLAAVVATQVGIIALLPSDASFQGLAPLIAAYTCGTLLSLRKLSWALVTVVAVQGVFGWVFALPPFTALSPPAQVPDVALAAASGALSAALNFVVLGFVGNHVALRRRMERLERLRVIEAHKERTNAAIRGERTRMARELHDIAAHHLSGMVVQAGAAEKLAARGDPAVAETVGWIRVQGREALGNLRMVAGALRDSGEHRAGADGSAAGGPVADGAPVPGLAMLDRLVAGERALGSEVALEYTGSAHQLPPAADVMFYRVAQEALANARDHAWGSRVRVVLEYRESEVELAVDNGPGAERKEAEQSTEEPRGMGLLGMKERADLIGATLEAGPTNPAGWRVRLTLPCR